MQPSRVGGPYPDWLDWVEFKEDRAHELLRWRKEVIRSVDTESKITMHGIAYTLESLPSVSQNDWRAAAGSRQLWIYLGQRAERQRAVETVSRG